MKKILNLFDFFYANKSNWVIGIYTHFLIRVFLKEKPKINPINNFAVGY
jgi:hypothetical protein